MPRSSTGKWVARAGSTGGGRTYRGQMPVNWYAALVLIIIVGLASVVFARYEYQRGAVANTVPPTKGGTPWFAALAFDVCGTQRPPLPSNALDTVKQSFYTTGNGVITISPKSTGAAGHNAVLAKFVSGYKGLTLTATELRLPSTAAATTPITAPKKGKKSSATAAKTYRNGGKCPTGTKDAGKKGVISVTYWPSAFSSKEKPVTVHANPGTVRFTDDQLITVGFVPAGTKLPKPSGSIITALLNATAGSSSTPTTAPASTSTTAPAPTSTTKPASTSTTAPASTSTTKPAS